MSDQRRPSSVQQSTLPMLLENGSRHDWREAKYSPKVLAGAGHAKVQHRLEGAAALRRLIDKEVAAWAIELRCPKTLMARVETSPVDHQVVHWSPDDVDDAVYIVPGAIALKELSLDDSALTSLWADAGNLRVPAGWWLVKGDARRAKTLTESLLKFQRDKKLAKGCMEVAPDHGSGRLRFKVKMASSLFERARLSRDLQVAALVGVCSWFPRVFAGDPIDEEPLAQELRERLQRAKPDVVLWDDDNYDPALVATLLEPFYVSADTEKDEDD